MLKNQQDGSTMDFWIDECDGLCKASEVGHTFIVNTLLSAGARSIFDSNNPQVFGDGAYLSREQEIKPPLWFASTNGHTEVVRSLLVGNKRTLYYSVKEKRKQIFIAILGVTNLDHCVEDHFEIFDLLLRELEGKGSDSTTNNVELLSHALLLSAKHGHASLVKSLLNAGASIEFIYVKRDNVIEDEIDLISYGCDHDDTVGKTALHLAVQYNHLDVANLLIENEAAVNCSTKEEFNTGQFPLELAYISKNHEMLKLLAESGANLNQELRDGDGLTILMHAAKYGKLEVVRILASAGADLELESNHYIHSTYDIVLRGRTAFMFAKEEGHKDVMLCLFHEAAKRRSDGGCT